MFQTVDRVPRLDIHAVARNRGLVPGVITRWRCQDGARKVTTVAARVEFFKLLISVDGGAEVPIELATLPNHLGGSRNLMVCGGCGVRRWHLYIRNGTVACRQCHGLRYSCRHEGRRNPKLLQASKLRARLVRSMCDRKRCATMAKIAACEAQASDRAAQRIAYIEERRPWWKTT